MKMIITLAEAQAFDVDITQSDLDAFETSIRELTNNSFQNTAVRFHGVEFPSSSTILVFSDIIGLKAGDTIEVNYSRYNDGLYMGS
jgi:hypothetical protein